jgi:hypothetical protein
VRGALIAFPKVPPNGSFIQEHKTRRLYLVARGAKLRLTGDQPHELDMPNDRVITVPWGTLDGIPDVGPYGKWKARLAPIAVPVHVYGRKRFWQTRARRFDSGRRLSRLSRQVPARAENRQTPAHGLRRRKRSWYGLPVAPFATKSTSASPRPRDCCT